MLPVMKEILMTTIPLTLRHRTRALLSSAFILLSRSLLGATYPDALIKDVPHVQQRADFCGEACVEMVLRKLGQPMDQNYVYNQSGLDPALGRGCYTRELAAAMRKIGFKAGDVMNSVAASNAVAGMESEWQALHADLLKGVPSIVCMHSADGPEATEHFRLVLGYDAKSDEVIYHEPARTPGAYLRMPRERFMRLWPLKYEAARWTVIRLRAEPGAIASPAPTTGFTPADFAQHVMILKPKLPDATFSWLVQPPFVVVSDAPTAALRRYSEGTVKWAVDKLKRDYFDKDPSDILDIWLFKDKTSYDENTLTLFNEAPDTPFGFYSDRHKALIMNIATGGGTLVHEIVHPFMASNIPQCPAWLNEGLGSLYEQCEEKDGHIHGLTNWRLAGLQEAITAQTMPSIEKLVKTTTAEFYGKGSGVHYAEARYLCYYLQEKNLLAKFYRDFHAGAVSDPTGCGTLKKVLGHDDLSTFQKSWEAYVLKLRFP